jgi:hypothetical protein
MPAVWGLPKVRGHGRAGARAPGAVSAEDTLHGLTDSNCENAYALLTPSASCQCQREIWWYMFRGDWYAKPSCYLECGLRAR